MLLTWLTKRWLTAFERRYDYDVSYMRFMLAASPRGFRLFAKVAKLAQHAEGVPLAPLCAAKLVSTMVEDCGPCTQIGVQISLEAGVSPVVLRAIVAGDVAALPPEVALAYRFAQASLAHDPAADELREEIRRLWGDQGVVALALALLSGRIYPTVKYALGYGQACQRVTIGQESIAASGQPHLRQVA
jgi:hypothetical protein